MGQSNNKMWERWGRTSKQDWEGVASEIGGKNHESSCGVLKANK